MSIDNQALFQELSNYERNHVKLTMDEKIVSPLQIVQAHMIREDTQYMRDYILNESGDLEELRFYSVHVL
ncbi:MAG: hypothetical protein MJ097_00710 [Dorea sp.]|nr:hypothetical protein [Dorea sp.]